MSLARDSWGYQTKRIIMAKCHSRARLVAGLIRRAGANLFNRDPSTCRCPNATLDADGRRGEHTAVPTDAVKRKSSGFGDYQPYGMSVRVTPCTRESRSRRSTALACFPAPITFAGLPGAVGALRETLIAPTKPVLQGPGASGEPTAQWVRRTLTFWMPSR